MGESNRNVQAKWNIVPSLNCICKNNVFVLFVNNWMLFRAIFDNLIIYNQYVYYNVIFVKNI